MNIANCSRQLLSCKLSERDSDEWKKSFIQSWNQYEDAALLVERTLGHKHRRLAMIKRELAILLQMGERWEEMEEALHTSVSILR